MRTRKTTTYAKIEANRRNANRSTGPRTERGKRNARFNAMTLGLFAKHVVIPICDEYKAEKHFQSLLDGLHQEFQPAGFYEEWLVVRIAECMWRVRRATRCESGSVRESGIWADRREHNRDVLGLASEISLLNEAEQQLRDSGTLWQKIYEQVVPLIEKERNKQIQSEKGNKSVQMDFDRELFLACIVDRTASLEVCYESLCRIDGQRFDSRFDQGSPTTRSGYGQNTAIRRENASTDRLGGAEIIGESGEAPNLGASEHR